MNAQGREEALVDIVCLSCTAASLLCGEPVSNYGFALPVEGFIFKEMAMLPLLFGVDVEKKGVFKWFPSKRYEMFEPASNVWNSWIGEEKEIDISLNIKVIRYKLVNTFPYIGGGLYEKMEVSK